MKKSSWGKLARDVIVIFIGCILIGASFNAFFDRFSLAPGGLSGLFVVIKTVTNLDLWISNLLFNIPLYILAFRLLGKEKCFKTFCGIVLCSIGFRITECLCTVTITNSELLSALLGGILLGVGTGIIFKAGGSTGGTGLIALLIGTRQFAQKISVPKIMGIADGLVILLAAITSKKVSVAIYSTVALLVVIAVSDLILDTYKKKKME